MWRACVADQEPGERRSVRRTNPNAGRRADDPIVDLATHPAREVTARQIAGHCKVSLQTVYKWRDAGKLTPVPNFTRELRFSTDAFRLFVIRELAKLPTTHSRTNSHISRIT